MALPGAPPRTTKCSPRERKLPPRTARYGRLTNPARLAPALAQLFAPGAAAAELRADAAAGPSLLHPVEAAYCSGFAPKRSADFVAGRLCARRALAELGITDFPIAMNTDRSPRWPPGVCGSISHTEGYRCAVAGPQRTFESIGIDAEIVGRVTTEIEALVFTPEESAFLAQLHDDARARAATIIFSAKEAFYKCQYALTHQWLDFHDVTIDLTLQERFGPAQHAFASVAAGWFGIVAPRDEPVRERRVAAGRRGRFRIDGRLVITGIAMRAGT